jgi:hypothetical protein
MLRQMAQDGLTLADLKATATDRIGRARALGEPVKMLTYCEGALCEVIENRKAMNGHRNGQEPAAAHRYRIYDAEALQARRNGVTLEQVIEQGGVMTLEEARQAVKAGRVSREDFPRKEKRR